MRTDPSLDGLTRSFGEETQRKVNTSTVDGRYNRSGLICKELSCGFHCPPYRLNSMMGCSGWMVFLFWVESSHDHRGRAALWASIAPGHLYRRSVNFWLCFYTETSKMLGLGGVLFFWDERANIELGGRGGTRT